MSNLVRPDNNTLYYPLCDSEIEDQGQHFLEKIFKTFSGECNSIISISTKNKWGKESLQSIAEFNKCNAAKIKLSVSVTSKYSLSVIEPSASSYSDRLKLVSSIIEFGIPTTICIKPMLHLVPFNEYKEVVDDFGVVCDHFVLGGLYLNKDSLFYKQHIEGHVDCSIRYCAWLGKECLYYEHPRYSELKQYLLLGGHNCYESDEEYVLKNMI